MLEKINLKAILSVGIGLFILYTSGFGTFPILINRPLFLCLLLLLGVLTVPAFKMSALRPLGIAIDLMLAGVIVASCVRIIYSHDELMTGIPFADNTDIFLACGLVVAIIELCRRSIGWVFTALIAVSLIYIFIGEHLSGTFSTSSFSIIQLTEIIYLSERGIWGSLVGISATYLAVFIMFAGFIINTGAGQSFIDIATRLGGSSPGGAAKIATVASGFFGMLAGSSVANVATTGSITIPMMRRLNYPPAFAGAVEAVASTGGQLTPPILGAAAFIIAEYVGISYWAVAKAAIIPATLFYFGVYASVHAVAVRHNLSTVHKKDIPTWPQALALERTLPLLFGLGGLAGGVINGNSLVRAVFFGIVGIVSAHVIVTLYLQRKPFKAIFPGLWKGFMETGHGLVFVVILLAGAQILVSVINLSGLSVTISHFISAIAGDNVLALGVLTAVVCLILGMGLPTIAAYVLVAAMMVAPLKAAGIPELSAHMFVMYYACLSAITPPVCVAVFIAAGLAESRWGAVAGYALRLGGITYLIPFLFLFYPAILLEGSVTEIAVTFVVSLIGVYFIASFLGGRWLRRPVAIPAKKDGIQI